MKAIEFQSKIGKKYIHIPKKFHQEIKNADGKDVRVIIFLDDSATFNDHTLDKTTME